MLLTFFLLIKQPHAEVVNPRDGEIEPSVFRYGLSAKAQDKLPELIALIWQTHVEEIDVVIMSVVCVLDGVPHRDGLGIDECVCFPTRGNIP